MRTKKPSRPRRAPKNARDPKRPVGLRLRRLLLERMGRARHLVDNECANLFIETAIKERCDRLLGREG